MNYRFLRVAATQLQLVLVKAAVAVVLVVIDLRRHLVGCKTSGNFRKYCKCSSGLPSKLAAALHATDPWGRGSNPAATHKPFYLFFKFPTPLIHGAGDRIPLTPTNVFIFFFKFCTPLIHGAWDQIRSPPVLISSLSNQKDGTLQALKELFSSNQASLSLVSSWMGSYWIAFVSSWAVSVNEKNYRFLRVAASQLQLALSLAVK